MRISTRLMSSENTIEIDSSKNISPDAHAKSKFSFHHPVSCTRLCDSTINRLHNLTKKVSLSID